MTTTPTYTQVAGSARPGQVAAAARSVDPGAILAALRAIGITHVITVPDTHQRTLLTLLAESSHPRLITVCTEDEAIAINAGVYIGGARPLLLIQNNGLYACLNALKAISLDARVPTLMLVGEHGRDLAVASRENSERSVRMLEPTLELWEVPYFRLDDPEHLSRLEVAHRLSIERAWPVAVLLGAPTGALTQPIKRKDAPHAAD